MKPSAIAYFNSLSAELDSQALRVRQLIGSAHWGHDGRHHELLLAELVRRHCPSSVLVSTGFVISPNDLEIRSFEQDILVVDTTKEAPLFNQGGLVIAFAHTILAAISVKATMTASSLKDTIDGLQSVRRVARDAAINQESIWCGGFFFRVDDKWLENPMLVYENIKRCVLNNPALPPILDDDRPHISGPNFMGDSSMLSFIFDYERNATHNVAKVRGYSGAKTATSVFLSCLLEHLTLNLNGVHSPFTDFVANLSIPPLAPPSLTISES